MRYYCHTRYVYLAMSLLQGGRVQFDLGPIGRRTPATCELYGPAWAARRVSANTAITSPTEDAFEPPNLLIRAAERVMGWYDRFAPRRLRERALNRCADLIARDLSVTEYFTLSPVNGTLNALALHARGAKPAEVSRCVEGFEFYRWGDVTRGLRYSGGSTRVWDTGFAVEALVTNPALRHANIVTRFCEHTASSRRTR